MNAHVHLERARLSKALPAVRAAVALLARVHALVAFEVAGVREAFATQCAHVRFLSRVHAHVRLQVFQARQRFPAAAAHKRPRTPTTKRGSVIAALCSADFAPLTPPLYRRLASTNDELAAVTFIVWSCR